MGSFYIIDIKFSFIVPLTLWSSWRVVLGTTLCDKDHSLSEILLKVALNTITSYTCDAINFNIIKSS
jgi:hypothetical protein